MRYEAEIKRYDQEKADIKAQAAFAAVFRRFETSQGGVAGDGCDSGRKDLDAAPLAGFAERTGLASLAAEGAESGLNPTPPSRVQPA